MKTTAGNQKRTIVCACLPVATLAFGGCNISPGGGGSPPVEVLAEGIATLQIPAGALVDPEQVVIRTTMENATDEAFWNTGSLYNVNNRVSYEVRINTGSAPPSQPVHGEFIVPDDFIQANLDKGSYARFVSGPDSNRRTTPTTWFEIEPKVTLP